MASSSSTSLSFSLLILLSLLSLSSSAKTLTKAVGILSDSGYSYISYALDLTSNHSVLSYPPSLTVFAPSDAAYINSNETFISVYLLHYHLIPFKIHPQSLKSLRFGTRISTMLPRSSLTVTTRPGDRHVSLNNVTVAASPIYEDGCLVIYGIDAFFDQEFQISGPTRIGMTVAQYVSRVIELMGSNATAAHYVGEAGKLIKSHGSSATASFVGMEILTFVVYQARLTFSRRVGHVTLNRIGGLSQYSSIFRRHVAPCKLYRNDFDGAAVFMSRNDSVLPETCRNDWLLVPGISEVLELTDSASPSPIYAAKVKLFRLWNTATTAPVKFLFTLLSDIYGDMRLSDLLFCLFFLICFEALGFGVGSYYA